MDRKRRKTMKKRYVPPEIVREIFLHLPCKSLCRFRSISKQYKSHVDDFQFMEEHRKGNMKASHLLTWDTRNVSSNLHLFKLGVDAYTRTKIIPTSDYYFMLPSSYGMACLYGWGSKKIALFNPSSEEIIPVPDSPVPFAYETINYPCAPTPTEWRYNHFGFGFDPKTRRYKIVQFIGSCSNLVRFHILTVKRNDSSWRTVDVSDRSLECFSEYDTICVDGVLYQEICLSVDGDYIDVLVFDLGSEDIKIIKSPAKWRSDYYGNAGHLALLDGDLCCYDMTPPTDMLYTMNIWKLKQDFANNVAHWTLWHKLQICGLNSELSPLVPLHFYEDKRILFKDEFLIRFYCYGIEDKRLKIYPLVGEVEAFDAVTVHSETITHPLD